MSPHPLGVVADLQQKRGRPPILVRLDALGVTGKQRRPLAVIDADIKVAIARLSRLKRERKAVVVAANLNGRRHEPEFRARFLAGIKRGWEGEKGERRREAARQNAKKPRSSYLPPLGPLQKLHYRKLRRSGISRPVALAEVQKMAAR